MRIIANVMVDIRNKTMESGASFAQQYPLKKGLKVFGEAGKVAALKEVDQLYKRSCFTPINVKDLSNRERRKAQVAIMLLTKKTLRGLSLILEISEIEMRDKKSSTCKQSGLKVISLISEICLRVTYF